MGSNNNYKTQQEEFWAGNFGDEYVERSNGAEMVAGRLYMFSQILRLTKGIKGFIEFGPNVGLNMIALHQLMPNAELHAVEINSAAVEELRKLKYVKTYHQSLLESDFVNVADFSFCSGVLIHVNPDELPKAYDLLYKSSRKYIMVNEYFNPSPMMMDYRGHKERLYKRDFAGEILDRFPDLELVDYGFIYRRDANFAQDDTNWFLLEKTA